MDDHTRTARLTRRSFLAGAMASAGMLAAQGTQGVTWAFAAGPAAPTRNPLYIPPAATPSNFPLSAAPANVNVGGSQWTQVLAYNTSFPGPTFRANRGDNASVVLTNGLSQQTTVHWHGMVVPTVADGHPKDAVGPGGRYSYQFPIIQRACLNWYHPHPHMLTAPQVALGLAGAFIVNDAEEAALGLPTGAYEVPLVIRDTDFDSTGKLIYKPRSSGYLGKVPLVNGTRNPQLNVDTALYRFRVLNGANGRIFRLALGNGAPFQLIGNDGGLLETRVPLTEITIGPAERLDVLVDFRTVAVGTTVMLRCLDAGWDLLRFDVKRLVTDTHVIPTALSTIPRLSNPVTTRIFNFDGMSRINGLEYALDRIDFQVPFGQTELWRFSTGGNAPHPVHVHGASFQVQSRSGGRGQLFPWESGWKDTVLLQDRETAEVLIRFDGYRGLYLLHCHKLEHEDAGMMSNFEVV